MSVYRAFGPLVTGVTLLLLLVLMFFSAFCSFCTMNARVLFSYTRTNKKCYFSIKDAIAVLALPLLEAFVVQTLFEPRREKTGFLHMRKPRRRSASR